MEPHSQEIHKICSSKKIKLFSEIMYCSLQHKWRAIIYSMLIQEYVMEIFKQLNYDKSRYALRTCDAIEHVIGEYCKNRYVLRACMTFTHFLLNTHSKMISHFYLDCQ